MNTPVSFETLQAVAVVEWRLETATPLCIKSGGASTWRQGRRDKTRNIDAEFDFFNKNGAQHQEGNQVSDFYHWVELKGGTPMIHYHVPPSSIRGALRGHTLQKIVDRRQWGLDLAATAKPGEGAEGDPDPAKAALHSALQASRGWQWMKNLFGMAADESRQDAVRHSQSGRLRIETRLNGGRDESPEAFKKHLIHGTWAAGACKPGSRLGKMIITPRSPLCRITQAAKQGGLHYFMELDKGNTIDVTLRILNPDPEDIGMLAFWEQEIQSGMLRFGGLTAIGRGRMNLSGAALTLYRRDLNGFDPSQWERDTGRDTDGLAWLLPAHTPTADWRHRAMERLNQSFSG